MRHRDPGIALTNARRRAAAGLLLAGAALACASQPQSPQPEVRPELQWKARADRFETTPLPLLPLEVKGAFRTQVEAERLAPPKRDGDDWALSFDIGSGVSVECRIHDGNLDLATAVLRHSRQDELADERVAVLDGGRLGDSPFLAIYWIYGETAGREELRKVIAASKAGRGITCEHDEFGYQLTFWRAVESFVEKLEFATSAAFPPHYEQVIAYKINGLDFGVDHSSVFREGEITRAESIQSYLMPIGGSEVKTNRIVSIEWTRPDGTLLRRRYDGDFDGAHQTALLLEQVGPDRWKVSGRHQGAPLDVEISEPRPIVGSLGEFEALRKEIAAHGVDAALVQPHWLPITSPGESSLVIRRSGMVESGEFTEESVPIRFRIVHEKGGL